MTIAALSIAKLRMLIRPGCRVRRPGLTFLCLALSCLGSLSAARAAETRRPNILFLFADDYAYEAVHALGNAQIHTPQLDRLVEQGTTFTRAYNMGGWHGAICVASRTMLNTGRFLWHAESVDKTCEDERAAGRLWSELMRAQGYRTYMTGKWHVQAKAELAFDVVRHVRPGMPKDTEAAYNRPLEGQPDPWSSTDTSLGGFWEGGRHWSEVVADDAIDYLAEAAGRNEPFFMYVAFNAPHDPRQAPPEYVDQYPEQSMLVPESFLPLYPYHEQIGCGPTLRDEKLGPFPRTEYAVRVHRREYYAIISHLDAQLGRILEALRDSGQAENTWIFFTADHGLAVGHHGLLGKQNMYDHSVRVPFIVKGPGVRADRRVETPIYLQAVMPTSLALAGLEQRPEHVEFESLLPLLESDEPAEDRPIYGAYMQLQRMVTHDGFKLILYPEAGVFRLYQLATDPLELHDLAGQEEFLPRARQLFSSLLTLQDQFGDTLNLREKYPALAVTLE